MSNSDALVSIEKAVVPRKVTVSIAMFAERDVRVFVHNASESLTQACLCVADCTSLHAALRFGETLGVEKWSENTELNTLFRYDGETTLKVSI